MSGKHVVLTKEGLQKLEAELQNLKIHRRKEVAEKIKEARGQGDLSENAEYDSAKEEQAEIEARISSIEIMFRNVELIDSDSNNTDTVTIGAKVKLYDFTFEEEIIYSIVGSVEADPLEGKISNESLLGSHLIGKSVGETVSYETEDGTEKFDVLEIIK
ncbi:MAG: transcription elongation factor GreA [Lachnospirales bacterium]